MNDVLWIFDSWQSLVNTLILFFGFLATIWSIRKNTEARKISLFHDMTKEERAISLKLFEIARDIKNKTYEGKDKEKNKEIKDRRAECNNSSILKFFRAFSSIN